MSPAELSGIILVGALLLFVSEKVRHDLVALMALFASLLFGLVAPKDALDGFGDPAVIAVAAVLVVGRALESSGVASALTARLMPANAGFPVRMAILLAAGAFLSAFMNNIAALVITMPIATEIARTSKRPPGAILMPLAFATILGGMTTLIGTPANLIISSVRERALGEPFDFFTMTPVGVTVTVIGLLYLGLIGWRLLPVRQSAAQSSRHPWMSFELEVREDPARPRAQLVGELRRMTTRMTGVVRDGQRIAWPENGLRAGDRLQLISRTDPWQVAESLDFVEPFHHHEKGVPLARVSVAHGSPLIGRGYGSIGYLSSDQVRLIAAGPRMATAPVPQVQMDIRAGDQLFIEGRSEELARFATRMRLLEIDRFDRLVVSSRKAYAVAGIFVAAILSVVFADVPPALAFLAAAAAIGGARLLPAKDIYSAIDWSIILLLAAMIPVGASFESSGAATIVADWLGGALQGQPLAVAIGAMCLVTMLLSIFLNNVATALIMGPLGIKVGQLLGVPPDAMLLAVLIGASSDFLTPIGHQNNLLVMGPGGYRFTDYIRMGGLLATLVVTSSALFLAWQYG
ncbi:MAG: SLC13 family permease [Novosphingobium sp.]